MPVEIRELVIRAVVEPGQQSDPARRRPGDAVEGKDAIVEACVRQVLAILKKSTER